ncbi:MAG: hypothetical protein ACLGXA_19980, partial [Acidobacteriota bacterium]
MKFRILGVAIFGASLAWSQQNANPTPPPPVLVSGQTAAGATTPSVTDAERQAVAVTAWDLNLHLMPQQQSMEVHARVTLRNAGAAPLAQIALQLSSTLHFETLGFRGKKIAFTAHSVASDADHTGRLTEAVISLPEPLAPTASMTLDVDFGGTIPLTAERLTAIGAPAPTAEASDWDRISEDFTGVRGFGNVVWYPVSSIPVSLADGAKLFDEIGRQKQMDEEATVSLRITDEFFSPTPNAIVLNGQAIGGLQPAAMPTASFPGVITASLPATRLGFETPSFFVARRTEINGHGLRLLATDADTSSAQRYLAAAALAEPVVTAWLGKSRSPITILDLPEAADAPAETGELLATPFSTDDAPHLAPVMT